MKTLVFWIAAAVLALYLLLRYRRGAPRRLAGRYSARFVQMVSVLLVAAGCGAPTDKKANSEPPIDRELAGPGGLAESGQESSDVQVAKTIAVPLQDLFPHSLGNDELDDWLVHHDKNSDWASFKKGITFNKLEPASSKTVASLGKSPTMHEIQEALRAIEGASLGELEQLLLTMERAGVVDTWLTGYFYQAASKRDEKGKASLYGLLESHNRVAESFVIALGQSDVVRPKAWMSKAGPRPGYQHVRPTFADPDAFLKEAERRYKKQDSGTWNTQARVAVALESGRATLHRRKQALPLKAQSFYLRRLDVMHCQEDCKVRLPFLGLVTLPNGSEVTSTSLYDHLSKEAQELAASYIEGTLVGEAEATRKVGLLLPILADQLRQALITRSDAEGASTIRSMLFDAEW